MKKRMKKTIVLCIGFILLFSMVSLVNASGLDTSKFANITTPNGGNGVYTFGGKIIYIIQYVGYTVAVLVLISIRS